MRKFLLTTSEKKNFAGSTLPVLFFAAILFLASFTNRAKAQTADFTSDITSACTPATAHFTDQSTGATSWLWDFGNSNTATTQNASANYPSAGTYTVTLTINGGGGPNLVKTKTLYIYPKPNPTIPVAQTGCAPFSTTLTAHAVPVTVAPYFIGGSLVGGITGGASVTYTWNFFGDLPTVVQSDSVLTLTNVPAGNYDLLLTITDANGCSNFVFKQNAVIVNPTPTASFTFVKQNLCGVGNVTFSGIATVSPGSIANYAWDINNDGSIESTLQNFTYNFATAGTYNVAFTATSDLQCPSAKIIKQITFNSNNYVGFTYSGHCVGQTVAFTDSSSASVANRDWNFGDGSAHSAAQNPNHTFSSTGNKVVTLTLTFTDGCVMSKTDTVKISGATASFTYSTSSSCAPSYTIGFTSTATSSVGTTITGLAWDFDNNGTTDDITATPTHSFGGSGTFYVRLTVTTSNGCTNSTLTGVVIPASVIGFSATPIQGCVPLISAFSPIYSNGSDPIVSYSWNFGDPTSGVNDTSTASHPSHTFNNAGFYNVALMAHTTNGCTLIDTIYKVVRAGTPQTITSLTYNQASLCQTTSVNFYAGITTLVDSLVWNFHDGNIDYQLPVGTTIDSTVHDYAIPDSNHSVTLIAYYNGCPSNPVTINNIIINEPVASFTTSNLVLCTMPTSSITFTNTSASTDADSKYLWDFGDGQTSILKSPSHIYDSAGDFTVKLTVHDTVTGCSDDYSLNIHVTTSTPIFTVNDSVACSATTVTFTNQVLANSSSNFSILSYLWTFGDGQTSTLANPTHSYTTPGLYTVSLKVTELKGCEYTYTRTSYMDIRGPIVNFTNHKATIEKASRFL